MTRKRDPFQRPFVTINTVSYCCSVYQANAQDRREKQKNQLNERQSKVLRAVNHIWEKDCRKVYSRKLRQKLEVEFSQVKDAEKAAQDTLDQLVDKGLLDKRKTTLEGKGSGECFYKAQE